MLASTSVDKAASLNIVDNNAYLIAQRIESAASLEEIKETGNAITELLRSLHDQGVKPRYISRSVTDLNRRIFRKFYQRSVPPALLEEACLIVMGSEGRGEQLLRTDQDNGLILRDGLQCKDLKRLTMQFTDRLVELGFPRCPGHIMVSNPAWAKSVSAYKDDIYRWIDFPDKNAFMNFSIFFDASTAAGNDDLLEDVKRHLRQLLRNKENAVQHFARAVLSFDTPLNMFGRFVVEGGQHKGEFDIKKGGIFPLVHGMRSLAMEHHLPETNTIARIQALGGHAIFDERFGADLIEAFDCMSMLRLREQLRKLEQGIPCDNYVNPGRLTRLDRKLLQESLKIVKEFKEFISYHFKLSLVT